MHFHTIIGKQFCALVLFEHLKYHKTLRLAFKVAFTGVRLFWIESLKHALRIYHNKNLFYCTNVLELPRDLGDE